ncbi:TolC family outer membrane protein [Vibrio cholerae]|uniref:TolC family outer membrane protein n=1 Tax=Vibrio cholerae TaxID=666 RepID=UPI00285AB7FD|nr:TolC family outer membrane protein [Vibrio cholerae]EKF9755691.1 TolC family outer membrane protein [Vibrio cholerae]ELE5865225.1 TolC family outer membrane protein [Vibrio cholerae]ELG7081216.1 TolC family outer membrane protein [Vibrio cholerae]
MRIKIALLASLLASPMSQAISLEESVAFAMDYSPEVLAQYARYQSAIRDGDVANGNNLPQVNLYGAVGYEETRYNSGTYVDSDDRGMTRSELGLKISQLLFDGFSTRSNVDRLGYEAEAARLTLISRAENVSLDVVKIYLELLKAQTMLQLTERNVREHQEIYQNVLDKTQKGLSSNSDLAQIAARVATAQSSLISAQNNLFDLQTQFLRQVGRPAKGLVDPIFDDALLPHSVETAIQQGVDNHPEIKAAMLDMEAARQEVRREKGGYYPEVKLELHANRNENVGNAKGPDEDARVMLTVDYDLFNGFSTNARVESSAWRVEEARAIRLRAEREVREGTQLAWNAYEMLDKQMQLLQQNVDAAKIAELGYIQQFNVGRRSLLDVLDAKVEVFFARRNYMNAQYDHTLAAYRLFNAMGMLSYALRVEHPEEWQGGKNNE